MIVTIDGHEVFMAADDVPAFTFALQDPLDLRAIRGSRSTTFKVPATVVALTQVGGPAMSEEQDRMHELFIGEGGNAYIKNTVRVIEQDRDTVRLLAVGRNASWMDALKERKINELDLGESPLVNNANQEATWDDEDGVLYYPLIDYGDLVDRAPTYNVTEKQLRPAVRVHRILSNAFNEIGYTVKVSGRLNNTWKKFLIPNTVTDIRAIQASLDLHTTHLRLAAFPQAVALTGITRLDVPVDTADIDPSAHYLAPSSYDITIDATVRVTCDFILQWQYPTIVPASEPRRWVVTLEDDLGAALGSRIIEGSGDDQNHNKNFHLDFGPVDMNGFRSYRLRIQHYSSGYPNPTQFDFLKVLIQYTPENIPYNSDIQFRIASALPPLSVLDVVKAMVLNRCLVVQTDDAQHTVTFSLYDDHFRDPSTHGVDFTARLDHTEAPVKVTPITPRRVDFLWQEDGRDTLLQEFRRDNGRGLGDALVSVDGGSDDVQEVTMPFAPTYMSYIFDGGVGGVLVARLRDAENGTYQVADYDWEPRLLISDGMAAGEWTFDGVARTEYPKCYFCAPGERFTLAFDTERIYGDCAPGTTLVEWASRLRRLEESKLLKASLLLHDDEMQDIDFGRPVLLHDGEDVGWYYFSEIRQKRFGRQEPTECELIQQ